MIISFENSFASQEKSKFWNFEKNELKPEQVTKTSYKKYWLNCECGHTFEISLSSVNRGRWCCYCCNPPQKMCSDINCVKCKEKSFASHEKSKFWCVEKNGEITPRQVFKSSTKKYWFKCDDCNHFFEMALVTIMAEQWCYFCSSKELCSDINCVKCKEKSFASHEKSKNWCVEKNGEIKPRQVFKSSHKKYWFKCDVCNHFIEMALSDVSNGYWCGYCGSKKFCDDENCQICFNKSFASHEKSKFWSEKNTIEPKKVFNSTNKKYWFNCDLCFHTFETTINQITGALSSWCSYCGNKILCDNQNCQICFDKSFASQEKSKFWSEKNEELTPREVFKSSSYTKYWFDCGECNHSFSIGLNSVSSGNWCIYCAKQKLCDNDECKFCFDNSFASNIEKSKCWSKKNDVQPRQVFKSSSNIKYWFDCNVCNNLFSCTLNCLTGKNSWCPFCVNKTETKLFTKLLVNYPSSMRQFKQDWCKNINYLPFDFFIPELNIIIELDGRQHFKQVSNWKSPEETQANDKFKEKCANENGYSIIRLLQEDVFYDKYDWFSVLLDTIEELKDSKIVKNIYLCRNDEYKNYL